MAVVASSFVWGIRVVTEWRETALSLPITVGDWTLEVTPLIALWVTAGLVILIRRGFQAERWHGPADAVLAAHRAGNSLNVKQGIGSTLAAFVGASGGASVGQYGPLVHAGATVGAWIERRISSRLPARVYLACGVAAAISAGFGAPLAGIVFAHEAILRHFSIRALAPIAIASVVASALNAALFPSISGFQLPATTPDLTTLVPVLILSAPLMAAAALVYMGALLKVSRWASQSGLSTDTLIVLAATGCGLVGLWLPDILGVGIGPMNAMLNGEYAPGMLITLLCAKIAMTALCIGFGLFGGTFSPALFVGIAAGSIIGVLAGALGFTDLSVALAVAAMAAVAAALVGAPMAAVLIALELTHSYVLGVAALTAVVATTVLTHRLFGSSFYDRQLLERGIDLSEGREAMMLATTPLRYCRLEPGVIVSEASSGHDTLSALAASQATEGYVLDQHRQLIGKVTLYQALSQPEASAGMLATREPLTLKATQSLQAAMDALTDFVGEGVPVIDAESGRFLGVLTEGALFSAIQHLQSEVRHTERN